MFRNSVTSKLRRRTSSCILASSIAVATIAVAGFTESPVRAAPVSFGQIIATRTVASDGSFNVYSGEEIEMSAGGNVSSTCLGQVLQPGDVVPRAHPHVDALRDNIYINCHTNGL